MNKRRKFFGMAVSAYNVFVALLLAWVIITSLTFSYEHYIGTLPSGGGFPIIMIAAVFASLTLIRKMKQKDRIADYLALSSNEDLLSFASVLIVGLVIAVLLIWGWIELYPSLFD
ncbi:MAG: hypothetical protein IJ532_01920 [Alphaproteobacteria bacterium]|nr:hypothetical protein [Alphaproteobacteria bacterium]